MQIWIFSKHHTFKYDFWEKNRYANMNFLGLLFTPAAHVCNVNLETEVNISSYPARILAGLLFFCRAEILNSRGFVQKYSDQGVSCKNIGQ